MFSSSFSGLIEGGSAEEQATQILEVVRTMGGGAPPADKSEGSDAGQRVLPSAPSVALPVSTVASTAREAQAQKGAMDVSVADVCTGTVPLGLVELLEAAGTDVHISLDLFCGIPEAELMDLIADVAPDDTPLTSIQKSSLIRFVQNLFRVGGFVPPALGSALPQPASQPAPPAAQPAPHFCKLFPASRRLLLV